MRVVVVGGGISGLAAAHRLLELSRERGEAVDVRLLEAGERLGGVIATERRDGFILERGPDSMITDKPWGLDLVRRLGIEDRLIGTGEAHRRSFVVRAGKLVPVPEGFQLLAPSRFGPLAASPIFSWPGKVRMALDLLIPPRRSEADESLGDFVLRRLGREALERMAQPMIAGIYGADPMKLSLQATLPRFRDMERKHGSVIRGMWARGKGEGGMSTPRGYPAPAEGGRRSSGVSGARYGLFVSFREGMQTLVDVLGERLPAGCVSLATRVEGLRRAGGGWALDLAGGRALEAEALVLAVPAHAGAALLEPLEPALRELREISYASCATMSLCYRREDVPHPLDGFGFVVPAVERVSLLGCTFTHVKFPSRAPEGMALLRAFLGEGALAGRDDRELERLVRADLAKLVGVRAEPLFVEAARWQKSMPQYAVGHLERIARARDAVATLPRLALAGNAYGGVGIPDCVHSGEQAAEQILSGSG